MDTAAGVGRFRISACTCPRPVGKGRVSVAGEGRTVRWGTTELVIVKRYSSCSSSSPRRRTRFMPATSRLSMAVVVSNT